MIGQNICSLPHRREAGLRHGCFYKHGFAERARGGDMDRQINSFGAIIRRPSAFLPLAMSLTALAMLLGAIVHGYVAGYGVVRETDEGAIAHLWQLLMAGTMPIPAFFAIKCLPRAPRQTLYVIALQAGAALASMAPVFFLNL